MVGQVQTKKKALDAAESLLGYPDTKVKNTAQVVADYLKGSPAGFEDLLEAAAPEGSALAKMELRLLGLCASGRRYEFRRALRVVIIREEDYFLASDNRFLVHGTGDSASEALINYMQEWRRHYERLISEEDHLAPPLQRELARIRRLVASERDAA
ncbi:MAG: hypothetical protein Q8R28_18485 [Dehalococcoidia bacterium]|nr:hypothetical protein [Dehalococcoidia bacterium]